LAFGGANEMGRAACAGQDGTIGQPAGLVEVVAAFCVNSRVLREAVGHVAAADPQAPAFRSLLDQIIASLFRPDREQNGSDIGR
jgi:hypothetical protein